MKIDIKEVFENYFVFTINNEDVGTIETDVDEHDKDCWLATDYLDGITAQGKSRRAAAKNLYEILQRKDDKNV